MSAEIAIRSARGTRRARKRGGPKRGAEASSKDRSRPAGPFVLYVEGPRDRDLLRIWARRLSHGLAKSLETCVVIMGGRQPARALQHFSRVHGASDDASGLVVLDRDHHDPAGEWATDEWATHGALELYTWPRRHIESYVLVPEAIRRAAGCAPDDPRIGRVLAEHVPEDDPGALEGIDAKRLLGARGPLARELGRSVSTADIARCMRLDEVHADVLHVLERARGALGLGATGPEIVVRGRPR